MPARSRAQQRYLAAKFDEAWLRKHHFNTKGPLPARVTKGRTRHPLTRRMVEKGQL